MHNSVQQCPAPKCNRTVGCLACQGEYGCTDIWAHHHKIKLRFVWNLDKRLDKAVRGSQRFGYWGTQSQEILNPDLGTDATFRSETQGQFYLYLTRGKCPVWDTVAKHNFNIMGQEEYHAYTKSHYLSIYIYLPVCLYLCIYLRNLSVIYASHLSIISLFFVAIIYL